MADNTANGSQDPSGGEGDCRGGANGEKRKRISDTRLLERAIKQRWPIPDEFKEAIIKRQTAIAIDPNVSVRNATSAARAVISAEGQNQRDQLSLDEEAPPEPSQVDVTVNILQQIQETAEAVQSNDAYVDQLYQEQLREDPGQPSSNGNGHPS